MLNFNAGVKKTTVSHQRENRLMRHFFSSQETLRRRADVASRWTPCGPQNVESRLCGCAKVLCWGRV